MLGKDVPDSSGRQILIIDDDEDIRKMVEVVLKKEGYITVVAQDGLDGLNRAKLEPFDLVVLDLNMPRMSGQQFVKELAKAKAKVPILIITAQANPGLTRQELTSKYKRLDLLPKPFLPVELLDKVHKFID